ncbi:MAG: hypothetical protein N3D73_03065 [Candidatus Diapherotrites archaeon]|nr:hypothetical protein [Candidatus Diapherotrites archaeon]
MLYKWIYDKLYPKDRSYLSQFVEKFCNKLGYRPKSIKEFTDFLVSFDFVSLYDKEFRGKSYVSTLIDGFVRKYWGEEYVGVVDDEGVPSGLYRTDINVRTKFRAFLLSWGVGKRKIIFDKLKSAKISSKKTKDYYYHWDIFVIFLEYNKFYYRQIEMERFAYYTVDDFVRKTTKGAYSYKGVDEDWEYFKKQGIGIPDFIISLDEFYKIYRQFAYDVPLSYCDYIEKKNDVQEIGFRKEMLNELLCSCFVEILLIFISFFKKKYDEELVNKILSEPTYNAWLEKYVNNYWIFHPFIYKKFGDVMEMVEEDYFFIEAVSMTGELSPNWSADECFLRAQKILWKFAKYVFSYPDVNRIVKDLFRVYRVPMDLVDNPEGALLYFLSLLPSSKKILFFGNISKIPFSLLPEHSTTLLQLVFFKEFGKIKEFARNKPFLSKWKYKRYSMSKHLKDKVKRLEDKVKCI